MCSSTIIEHKNESVAKRVTEAHVAAYSALAERKHLCRERCRVVIASVEDGQRETHIHAHSTGYRVERIYRESEGRGMGRVH